MASYKILKKVDGLEAVISNAKYELEQSLKKGTLDFVKSIHYQRFEAICETLGRLRIVDSICSLKEDLLNEVREKSQKCNS